MAQHLIFIVLLTTPLWGQAAPPPPWVPFSQAVSELVKSDEFREAFIKRLDQGDRAGGLLGPEQIERLRKILADRDWEALDRFPGITVRGMGRTFRVASIAEKALAKPKGPDQPTDAPPPVDEEDLGLPSKTSPPSPDAYLSDLGMDLKHGDRLDPALAPSQPNSARLAEVLNRLASNPGYRVRTPWGKIASPQGLLMALESAGHAIEVRDARYFANFGDLIYKGRDVLTPFWMDTGIEVPGRNHTLFVPAGHSQHELHVSDGPAGQAHVAFYFGIDGKAEFRAIDTLDQSWVLGRVAHLYRGRDALEVIRLAGQIIRVYGRIQSTHPKLPFGGYYALGVCNDVNAMIELKMQGATTLYPLTHDKKLFDGSTEVDDLARRLPIDGDVRVPDLSRVIGSLPVDEIGKLPLEPLRSELLAVQAASPSGTASFAILGSCILVALWFTFRRLLS